MAWSLVGDVCISDIRRCFWRHLMTFYDTGRAGRGQAGRTGVGP